MTYTPINKHYTLVEGDSFNTGVLDIDLTDITAQYGIADLSNSTLSAAFKDVPGGTPVDINAVIDDATAAKIHAFVIPFPAGLALGTEKRKNFQLDIQMIDATTSQVITLVIASVTVIWQADDTII